MTRLFVVCLLSLFALATGASAQTPCSVPNALTNGTNADATQVMANFNAILNCVNNSTSGRKVLTANTTYYVRTDGNDSNNGLSNTPAGAFLTIQKALNVVYGTLDLGGFNVTIQVGPGTYTGTISQNSPQVGAGTITLLGDAVTPSNVVVSTSGTCISITKFAVLYVSGFKLTSSAASALSATNYGVITVTGNMEFGSVADRHVSVELAGQINLQAAYTISGGAVRHWLAYSQGQINAHGLTITLTGTPAFSNFAEQNFGSFIDARSNTFSGSATGTRYSISGNATMWVNGAGATYLPGSSAGSIATGGQYL